MSTKGLKQDLYSEEDPPCTAGPLKLFRILEIDLKCDILCAFLHSTKYYFYLRLGSALVKKLLVKSG